MVWEMAIVIVNEPQHKQTLSVRAFFVIFSSLLFGVLLFKSKSSLWRNFSCNHTFSTTHFFFSGKKKNPSMYRRPSELGLATTPMEDKSEIRRNFQPVNLGRQHIVKPIPDHSETYHVLEKMLIKLLVLQHDFSGCRRRMERGNRKRHWIHITLQELATQETCVPEIKWSSYSWGKSSS